MRCGQCLAKDTASTHRGEHALLVGGGETKMSTAPVIWTPAKLLVVGIANTEKMCRHRTKKMDHIQQSCYQTLPMRLSRQDGGQLRDAISTRAAVGTLGRAGQRARWRMKRRHLLPNDRGKATPWSKKCRNRRETKCCSVGGVQWRPNLGTGGSLLWWMIRTDSTSWEYKQRTGPEAAPDPWSRVKSLGGRVGGGPCQVPRNALLLC